jgi:three-Cys-motif partner protein
VTAHGNPPRVSTMKRKAKREFFSKQTEQSRIKAEMIAKYFPVWAKVVGSSQKKLVYIDLYAGRGRYDDGNESTPLLVLRRAIDDPVVSPVLVTMFNDKNPDDAAALRAEIAKLPGIEKLKHKPKVYVTEVADETAKLFAKTDMAATLALLDPWGYKGLTRDLIHSLLKDWGCDLIFFFNYNRINVALTNKKVAKHMAALFGQAWLDELQKQVPVGKPRRRERIVLQALKRGLLEVGGKYVRPFRFLNAKGKTSHHLVFVSKNFKGLEIMRDIMAGMSSRHDDEVASFTYNPQMEFERPSPLPRLQARIVDDLARRTMTVRQIFVTHSGDSRFTMKNYQEALRRLEKDGDVKVKRRSKVLVRAGKATMPPNALVTFPPRAGAPGGASHSILAHQAAAPPPSASARPTA